jgi:hypothetical protein
MQLNDVSTPAFELGTWVGRRQAFALLANKCSAADAECLKQIRESKGYKSVAADWEQFCPRYLGLSRSHADKLIHQLEEFGTAYFELSQIVRIPESAYRAISGAISGHSIEYEGETIAISKENGPRVAQVVRLLRQEADQCSRRLVDTLLAMPMAIPTEQRKKLRAVRKRLEAGFQQLETISGSDLLDQDRAEAVALIEYGRERLAQLSLVARAEDRI